MRNLDFHPKQRKKVKVCSFQKKGPSVIQCWSMLHQKLLLDGKCPLKSCWTKCCWFSRRSRRKQNQSNYILYILYAKSAWIYAFITLFWRWNDGATSLCKASTCKKYLYVKTECCTSFKKRTIQINFAIDLDSAQHFADVKPHVQDNSMQENTQCSRAAAWIQSHLWQREINTTFKHF